MGGHRSALYGATGMRGRQAQARWAQGRWRVAGVAHRQLSQSGHRSGGKGAHRLHRRLRGGGCALVVRPRRFPSLAHPGRRVAAAHARIVADQRHRLARAAAASALARDEKVEAAAGAHGERSAAPLGTRAAGHRRLATGGSAGGTWRLPGRMLRGALGGSIRWRQRPLLAAARARRESALGYGSVGGWGGRKVGGRWVEGGWGGWKVGLAGWVEGGWGGWKVGGVGGRWVGWAASRGGGRGVALGGAAGAGADPIRMMRTEPEYAKSCSLDMSCFSSSTMLPESAPVTTRLPS